jgi:hypothetical protein
MTDSELSSETIILIVTQRNKPQILNINLAEKLRTVNQDLYVCMYVCMYNICCNATHNIYCALELIFFTNSGPSADR